MKLFEVEINKELWTRLDEIDGKTVIGGAELENWQDACAYQVENHPNDEIRAMFKRSMTMDNLTRKNARLLASLAYIPCRCEYGHDC